MIDVLLYHHEFVRLQLLHVIKQTINKTSSPPVLAKTRDRKIIKFSFNTLFTQIRRLFCGFTFI